jgi:tetrahydromethanopterin S-methyltransferase subunit F
MDGGAAADGNRHLEAGVSAPRHPPIAAAMVMVGVVVVVVLLAIGGLSA